jgi:hypothetical protein
MRRIGASRVHLVGVLARPPDHGAERRGWAAMVVDPVKQLEELADLRDRGLLSPEEFERQKEKVLEP